MKKTMLLTLLSALLWLSTLPSATVHAATVQRACTDAVPTLNTMAASASELYQACMASTQRHDESAMQSALLNAVTTAVTAQVDDATVSGTFYYEADDLYCITAEFASATAPLTKYTNCMASTWQYDETAMQSMLLDAVKTMATKQMGEAVASNVEYYESGEQYCISAEFTPAEATGTGNEVQPQIMIYLPILMR